MTGCGSDLLGEVDHRLQEGERGYDPHSWRRDGHRHARDVEGRKQRVLARASCERVWYGEGEPRGPVAPGER